jgi:hypothetical protein
VDSRARAVVQRADEEEAMMKTSRISGAMLFAALVAGPAQAGEKEAKALVERAIKAHGGEAALKRAAVCQRVDTGTRASAARDIQFTSKVTCSLPERVRLEIEADKRLLTVIVLDGDRGWQRTSGPAAPMSRTFHKEVREEAYVWWVATLVPLLRSRGFTLDTVAQIKVDGEPAAGVLVKRKGHADTRLYFLKRTGLLVRVERRATEAGVPVDKAYVYAGHRSFDGVMLHTKETILVNGKKHTQLTISDYRFPSKPDARLFGRP